MKVSELLKKLGKNKKASAELYKQYKVFKDEEESLKYDLIVLLKDSGLKSVKGQDFTASLTETPTIVIKDETALLEWLQNTPDIESDFYIEVKKSEFNTLAKQMLKETGELANGTEVETRESLAIRSNKK
jgi:hypothetical protein